MMMKWIQKYIWIQIIFWCDYYSFMFILHIIPYLVDSEKTVDIWQMASHTRGLLRPKLRWRYLTGIYE